ncbi:MAG TPA: hypothetical protein VK619_15200 [Pyrinomonadaceae bacterium]|nr:hypothetical protein [Pyrinomonadaceae bacterium]
MSEDLTKNLPSSSFEERVMAEFAAMREMMSRLDGRMGSLETRMEPVEMRVVSIDMRLTSLEDRVDARLRETRPIWESVLERLTGVESELNQFNRQLKTLITDMFKLRVRVDKLEDEQQTA